MAPLEPKAYTVKQTCEVLNLSHNHVWRLISRGELPVIRTGRRVLISRKALDEFLAGCSPSKQETPGG